MSATWRKAFVELMWKPPINITTESGIRKEKWSAIWDLGGACRVHNQSQDHCKGASVAYKVWLREETACGSSAVAKWATGHTEEP